MSRSEAVGAAWPAFLRYLATMPDPGGVAEALVDGPLATYRAHAAAIHRRDGDVLTLIGHIGYTEAEVSRGTSLSLALDMPASVAVRTQELVIESLEDAIQRRSAMSIDPDIWGGLAERSEGGGFVVGPIVHRGHAVGTYNFAFRGPADFDALDASFFAALGALLGLWLTHPDARQRPTTRPDAVGDTPPLSLTERQVRILQLAATGRSNPAIAANLGYSVSTVKQEMSRILDTLRAANRVDAIRRARELDLIGGDGEVARADR